jgi:hypothetical protein
LKECPVKGFYKSASDREEEGMHQIWTKEYIRLGTTNVSDKECIIIGSKKGKCNGQRKWNA